MKRTLPGPQVAVPISIETYQQLLCASGDTGFEKEDWEIAAMAIHDWMARHHPDTFHMPRPQGYQWKHLFLPHGTLLRTVFAGKNTHALVEQDQIISDGKPSSPSRFANAPGGMNRNAWKTVWLLFPNSQTWKLAATLRPKRRH